MPALTVQEAIDQLDEVEDKSRKLMCVPVADPDAEGYLPLTDIQIGLENEKDYDGIFLVTVGEPE
jgi:hypothetical protein